MLSDASTWRGLARADGSVVEEALEALELPNLLPALAPPTGVAGTLLDEVAGATGLPAGIPVVVGWNDLNCSLLGVGAVSPAQLFDIAGTSEHIGQLRPETLSNSRIASFPLAPELGGSDVHAVYGVSSNAGGLLDWLSATLTTNVLAPGELERVAATAPPGAEGLMCLPYLYGERSPVWDPDASGAFVGLRHGHGRGHLVRSALEGAALNLRQILELVPGSLPSDEPIRAAGGPSRLGLWNVIKASVLRTPIAVADTDDPAALGAAALAAAGVGAHRSTAAAAAAMAASARTVEPSEPLASLYDEMYPRFIELYPTIRSLATGRTPKEASLSNALKS
jgi:sugar (pentulose or hexulose) kinase